jgi:hypothetical protein
MGNEIYCYKGQYDLAHQLMHSLVGTFVKAIPSETAEDFPNPLWPIKIILPPIKSRVFYFSTQHEQQKWVSVIQDCVGHSDLLDFYKLDVTLGKG